MARKVGANPLRSSGSDQARLAKDAQGGEELQSRPADGGIGRAHRRHPDSDLCKPST